jgi:hypothetical protein
LINKAIELIEFILISSFNTYSKFFELKNNFDNIIIIRVFLYFAKVINEKETIMIGIKKLVMLNSLSIKCEGIETVELYPTI